jgi:hypothetical protein
MKKLMITGGLIGSFIGFVFAVVPVGVGPSNLGRAGMSAFAAGLVLRWWLNVRVNRLKQPVGQPVLSLRRTEIQRAIVLTRKS